MTGITKAKRSGTKRKNNGRRSHQTAVSLPHTKLFHLRQAKGKVVEKVEFSASPDHHDISIYFKDKTGLNFSIEAGFTLKTEYSDWKSGEQRIIRSWPLINAGLR